MATFRQILGRKIKDLRNIHGMTQMDLAYKLGYESTGMMSQIENGLKGMDHEKLNKLSKIFKVPLAALLSDKEIPKDDLKALVKLMEIIELPPEKRPQHWDSIRLLLDSIK